ncbi:hypothetical protein LSAT2_006352, partial [Lamellibrachia satsuma]
TLKAKGDAARYTPSRPRETQLDTHPQGQGRRSSIHTLKAKGDTARYTPSMPRETQLDKHPQGQGRHSSLNNV